MQRQVVAVEHGRLVHRYEDDGPSTAKLRRSARTSYLEPMPRGGHTLGDCLFTHPAAEVTRAPGEKVSR